MGNASGIAAIGAACGLVLVVGVSDAAAQTVAPGRIVAPAEQAQRDSERIRILRTELANEQSRSEAAVRRRAERLAARDTAGADDAEQAQRSATDNIDALRRELATAMSTFPRTAAPPAPVAASGAARWWDVYAKAPSPAAGRHPGVDPRGSR